MHDPDGGRLPDGTGVPSPGAGGASGTPTTAGAAPHIGREGALRLAKAVGVLVITASAVSQEYGSGINFVLTKSLGPYPAIRTLAPLAMLVAGLFLLPNVVMFDRFARVMPRAGSTYVWLTRSVTRPIGFLVAFLWFIGVAAAIGFLAFSFPTFIQNLLALVGAGSHWPTSTAGHLVIGLVLIWVIFLLHYTGVRNYGAFIIVLFGIVLFAAIATIFFGFTTSQGYFLSQAAGVIGHRPAHASSIGLPSPGVFFSVVTVFMFSYGGLAAATSLGGEARNATRSIGRGVWYAWGTALVLYTIISYALFHAVPWWAAHSLARGSHSALATTPGLIGMVAPRAIGIIIDIAVVVIVGKTVAPEMLDCSRYLFAWAQDGLIPARVLHTNRYKAPDVALLISAVLGSLFLVEATFYGFQIGVTLRSMSLVLVFGVLGIGILNLRVNPRYKHVTWAQRVARHPVALAAAVIGIIIAAVLEHSVLIVPGESLPLQPSIQALIALGVAVVLYAIAHLRARAAGAPIDPVPMEATLE